VFKPIKHIPWLIISLSRVSFLPPPVQNNIFYEIETSNTGLYNNRLGTQSTGGGMVGPCFGKNNFKNNGRLKCMSKNSLFY
jgi:hypothetical protein